MGKKKKKLFQCYQLLEILLAKLTPSQRHGTLELEGYLAVTKSNPLGKLRLSKMPWILLTNQRKT